MPTASRLVGAVYFAGLAFIVSSVVISHIGETTRIGPYFGLINAVIGFLCGWRIMGARAEGSILVALAGGLTTSAFMYCLALLVHSVATMVKLALRRQYDGALEALIGALAEAWNYTGMVARQDVVLTLLIGGLIGGLFAGLAARRWS